MSYFGAIKFIDSTGAVQAFKWNADAPQICAQDYLQALAEGDISGHSPFTKYGKCTVANTAMEIWESNAAYVFPVSAGKLDITSTDNVDDKAGGAGALKVKINGLNGSNADTTEEVTLNGTTIVQTSASFLRVNKMWVSSAGANGVPTGTLAAKVAAGATVYAQISPGYTQSRQMIYSVPSGKSLYITSLTVTTGVGNTTSSSKFNYVTFTLRAKRDPASLAVSTIWYPVIEFGLANASFYRVFEMPEKIPATADIKISVIGDTNQAVGVTCAMRGWIE